MATPPGSTHSAALEENAPLPLLPTPQLPKISVKPGPTSQLCGAQYPPLSAQVSCSYLPATPGEIPSSVMLSQPQLAATGFLQLHIGELVVHMHDVHRASLK